MGNLNSAGILCPNAHEILQRSDSAGKTVSRNEQYTDVDDYANKMVCDEWQCVLLPGQNTITLKKRVNLLLDKSIISLA